MTTAPLTLAKLAAQCISDCLPDATRDQAFSEIDTTAAAAALTSIITSAQVAEKIVDASPNMGNLQLCVIAKSSQPDSKTKQIILWNSIEDIQGFVQTGAMEHLQEVSERNTDLEVQTSVELEITARNNEIQRRGRLDMATLVDANEISEPAEQSDRRRDTTGANVTNNANLQRRMPFPTPASSSEIPFVIPRATASNVASKLLAGSGYYSHVSANAQQWPKSYGELYCKHVTILLQRIYETEKSLSGNPNMRYENLLPDHLLQKLVTIEGIGECTRQEKGRIPKNDMFVIDLSHRRGTQKHIAFAAICIAYSRLYRESGRIHAAKAVLDAYRKEGETEIGCNRFRERGANITAEVCNRSSEGSCLQTSTQQENDMQMSHVSILKDVEGVKKTVGVGTIDFASDKLNGNPVPNDMLIVNVVRSLSNVPNIVPGNSVLWKKENILRVNVLFNFKRPIRNAILVSSATSRIADTPLDGQEGENLPVVASYHGTDPSKAAVICDIRLSENMRNAPQIRYPYAEWYKMNQFQTLMDVHFRNETSSSGIPRLISARSVRKFNALLWHRDWISSANVEEHPPSTERGEDGVP